MEEHQVSLFSFPSLKTKELPLYMTWEYSLEKQYLVSWSAFFEIGWSSLRAWVIAHRQLVLLTHLLDSSFQNETAHHEKLGDNSLNIKPGKFSILRHSGMMNNPVTTLCSHTANVRHLCIAVNHLISWLFMAESVPRPISQCLTILKAPLLLALPQEQTKILLLYVKHTNFHFMWNKHC